MIAGKMAEARGDSTTEYRSPAIEKGRIRLSVIGESRLREKCGLKREIRGQASYPIPFSHFSEKTPGTANRRRRTPKN